MPLRNPPDIIAPWTVKQALHVSVAAMQFSFYYAAFRLGARPFMQSVD
jgi:hypothetical protein